MATAKELGDEFEATNNEVIEFAEGCSAQDWGTVVPGENWPVGVLIHHIAGGHSLVTGWIGDTRSGDGVSPEIDIDDANARHAEEFAAVSVAEAVALLRENGERALATIRSLEPADLERSAPFGPAGGRPMTVEQIASVAARHARGHLDSARATVGRD